MSRLVGVHIGELMDVYYVSIWWSVSRMGWWLSVSCYQMLDRGHRVICFHIFGKISCVFDVGEDGNVEKLWWHPVKVQVGVLVVSIVSLRSFFHVAQTLMSLGKAEMLCLHCSPLGGLNILERYLLPAAACLHTAVCFLSDAFEYIILYQYKQYWYRMMLWFRSFISFSSGEVPPFGCHSIWGGCLILQKGFLKRDETLILHTEMT